MYNLIWRSYEDAVMHVEIHAAACSSATKIALIDVTK